MNAGGARRVLALVLAVPFAAPAAVPDPFRLDATLDEAQGFGAPLANGRWAVAGTARGVDASPAFVAGVVEHAPDDVARPAAVPGPLGVDVRPWPTAADAPWIGRTPATGAHFAAYRQTLDLRQATLTTRYRFEAGGHAIDVELEQFLSRADPALGVTRLRLTPHEDGPVELAFPLQAYAPAAPRFALARLSGAEFEDAVLARGLPVPLVAHPPATPDRAAIWYAGDVDLTSVQVDPETRSLAITGRARGGAPVGVAAAIALPADAPARAVTVERSAFRAALVVRVDAVAGRSYEFTKYVAVVRGDGAGEEARAGARAVAARALGVAALRAAHRAAWERLWQGDIEIDGNPTAQQAVHAELYRLYAQAPQDPAQGLGPCGFATCYSGHVFWDSDTWVAPALLLFHPALARPLVEFRGRTLPAARARARARGLAGAMYPWEADPDTGTEQTPQFAHVLAESEIHVNAAVALGQWQYWLATGDRAWLAGHGWPVLEAVAQFYASRASYDPVRRDYSLLHVTSVAETHPDIANDTFTNLGARQALAAAAAAARALGRRPDPKWIAVATGLRVPLANDGLRHRPYELETRMADEDFGGGPLPLLFLPSLDVPFAPGQAAADYAATTRPGADDPAAVASVSMGLAPLVIGAAAAGADVGAWLPMNFTGGTLRRPWLTRLETRDNLTGDFLTGSGGFIQSLAFGLTGLRYRAGGLVPAYPPALPATWRSMAVRGLEVRGRRFDVEVTRVGARIERRRIDRGPAP